MGEAFERKIIGRAEKVDFPELNFKHVPARIDTGARTSSVWASKTTQSNGVLEVVFFDSGSEHYTGKPVLFSEYELTVVASSSGHTQTRYKVRLLVKLRGKKIRAWFTLADRSTQVYPVLIGRNVLLGKFVVDVKKGKSLKKEEQDRTESLRTKLSEAEEQE